MSQENVELAQRGNGKIHWETVEVIDGERLFVALKLRAAGRTSGIEGKFRIYQAWTIRNGKLVRLTSYLTRHEILKAAGLSG